MEVRRREDVHQLRKDVFEEPVRLLLAGAEHLFGDAPGRADAVGPAGASQLRIGGQGPLHVSGEVDFGDDRDAPFFRIGDDFAHLLLGIVAPVADAVVAVEVLPDHGAGAEGAHLGEPGVFLDLHAPSLVVGQVPVEPVHLEEQHQVERLLDVFDGIEVPRTVEQQAAVAEPGFVRNLHAGHREVFRRVGLRAEDRDRHQLPEGLERIEEAVVPAGPDDAGLRGNVDGVAFVAHRLFFQEEEALGAFALRRGGRQSDGRGERADAAAHVGDPVRQGPDGPLCPDFDPRVAVEDGACRAEGAFPRFDEGGAGNDVDRRPVLCPECGRSEAAGGQQKEERDSFHGVLDGGQ